MPESESLKFKIKITGNTPNAKPLQKSKSGFKRRINWNKYLSKVSIQVPNPYLDYLIDPRFQGVKRIFILSFENKGNRTVHTGYYLPKVEIKYYNVMIDGQKTFDQLVKNSLRTYAKIHKIGFGRGDDYSTGCLLDTTIILQKI